MVLASRGACNLDDGEKPIEDAVVAGQLRRRGNQILKTALLVAVLVAVGLCFLPL